MTSGILSVMRGKTRPAWSVDGRLRTRHLFIFIHNGGAYDSGRCEIYMGRPLSQELKVQNMPPQRNINSTRLRADKKKKMRLANN